MSLIARLLLIVLIATTFCWGPVGPPAYAQGAHGPTGGPPADATTPEERMQRRFPQPVRVASLIGTRLLDYDDVTVGRIRQVVRSPEGKVSLIVDFGGWFGWGGRPIALPIEVVALIGPNVSSIDLENDQLAKLPTWTGGDAQPLPPGEVIKMAITRR